MKMLKKLFAVLGIAAMLFVASPAMATGPEYDEISQTGSGVAETFASGSYPETNLGWASGHAYGYVSGPGYVDSFSKFEVNLYPDINGNGFSLSTMDMEAKTSNIGCGDAEDVNITQNIFGHAAVKGGSSIENPGEFSYANGYTGGSFEATESPLTWRNSDSLQGNVNGGLVTWNYTSDTGTTSTAGATALGGSISTISNLNWNGSTSTVHAFGGAQVSAQAQEQNQGAYANAEGYASYSYDVIGSTFAAGGGLATTHNMAHSHASSSQVHIKATSSSTSLSGGLGNSPAADLK